MVPKDQLTLPSLVVGPTDVTRLRRELESLNDYLREAELREDGQPSPKLPKTSRVLDSFAELNKLNLLQTDDRDAMAAYLDQIIQDAPRLHMSFATDPSAAFVDKIIVWLRQNIHPGVLLQIGLQPNIAAGFVLRTPNHYYDFSLRKHFAENHDLLIQKLESTVGA